MLAEEAIELAEAGHLGAVQAKAAGDLRKIAAAGGRMHRVAARSAELMRFRSIAAVVDDADQQLDPVPPQRLEFLDVLVEAAVAVDQQYLAGVSRDGNADRRRQARADGAEIDLGA